MHAFLRMGVMVLALGASAATATAQTGNRPVHGCFQVIADSLHVRRTAFASGEILGGAEKGDILIKRKPWCTWRGYWCAVRTEDCVEGYVDKKFVEMTHVRGGWVSRVDLQRA